MPRNKPHSKITKRKMSKSHKGKKFSEEHKKKIRLSHLGKKHTEKTKRKISENNKDREFSEETKRKISEAQRGEKNHNWRGGTSRGPYSIDWTKTLKRAIKERDKYICQLCGEQEDLSVHHIDYNKLNCNPNNLITLCNPCHSKTNYNRNYWIEYFKN